MTSESSRSRRCTLEEYFRSELTAEERHEFHDGVMTAMKPNSFRHSLINFNLICALGGASKDVGCVVLEGSMRVRAGGGRHYVYPDVSVLQGRPEFDVQGPAETTLLNPRVIVETTCPWTEEFDRGPKFALYRQIPELRNFVLVSDRTPKAECFHRDHSGLWMLAGEAAGPDATIYIQSLSLRIPLGTLYRGIDLAQ